MIMEVESIVATKELTTRIDIVERRKYAGVLFETNKMIQLNELITKRFKANYLVGKTKPILLLSDTSYMSAEYVIISPRILAAPNPSTRVSI